MPFLELFDETLDINSTENYDLSIQAGMDVLSYTVIDSVRSKYILFRSFTPESYRNFTPEQLDEIITRDDFLRRKYRKVHLVVPSAKSTLIPAPLYDPARKEDYFSFNHSGAENSVILTNRITEPDSYLLFGISRPVSEIVSAHYPQILPLHHLKVLFEHIKYTGKAHGNLYIHAHIESDFFNLIIFSGSSLKFCNSFIYRNVSDILYHILNVFKSMDIRQEEAVTLSGNAERYDDLFSSLSMYIRGVKFAEPAGSFSFSYVFNEMPLHRYLNLFTIAACE